jgi:hypothetical protein
MKPLHRHVDYVSYKIITKYIDGFIKHQLLFDCKERWFSIYISRSWQYLMFIMFISSTHNSYFYQKLLVCLIQNICIHLRSITSETILLLCSYFLVWRHLIIFFKFVIEPSIECLNSLHLIFISNTSQPRSFHQTR